MQNSMSMWSSPTTEEQQRYFSKHSPKLKVFGIAQSALQLGHIAIALSAWAAIYAYSLRAIPALQWAIHPLAIISLVVMHMIFKTSWQTFWYDRLDNDPNTDSQPWLPLAIIAVLLITEVNGARMFLQKAVAPPAQKDDSIVIAASDAEVAKIDAIYQGELQSINATFAPRISAATARFDKEIAAWNRRPTLSDNDVAFKRRNISAFEAKKLQAASKIEIQKSEAIEKAAARRTASLEQVQGRKTALLSTVDNHNNQELSRYKSEQDQAGALAWIISAALVGFIAALGYLKVRINVKSGIMPVRTFTDLDTHGSWFEQILAALSDAFKRRGTQFATWAHRMLSPSGTIHTLDGNVIVAPGNYNGGTKQKAQKQDEQTTEIDPNLKRAFTTLSVLLANFNVAQTPNDKIEAWNAIYNTRAELCAKGIVSFLTDKRVSVWHEEGSSFSDMIKRYPFPPATTPPAEVKADTQPIVQEQDLPKAKPKQTDQSVQIELEQTTEKTAPFAQNAIPEGAIIQEDGSILFKQSLSLFKQVTDSTGKVIGLKYKGKRSADWTTLGSAQVKSYFETYKKRYETTSSEAAVNGFDQWQWALGLFEQSTSNGNNKNIETITN